MYLYVIYLVFIDVNMYKYILFLYSFRSNAAGLTIFPAEFRIDFTPFSIQEINKLSRRKKDG